MKRRSFATTAAVAPLPTRRQFLYAGLSAAALAALVRPALAQSGGTTGLSGGGAGSRSSGAPGITGNGNSNAVGAGAEKSPNHDNPSTGAGTTGSTTGSGANGESLATGRAGGVPGTGTSNSGTDRARKSTK